MAKKGLRVGINAYPNAQNRLHGCVNDVTNIRNILKDYYGFENSGIHVLLDERATKAAMLDRLHILADKAEPNDFIVFHYSGHGSQIRDRDDEKMDDGLDELLCPVDMDWDRGTYIIDDELGVIMEKMTATGARLEVLLDCCHSYTGTKGGFDRPDTVADAVQRVRFMPAPLDIQCRAEGELLPKRELVKSVPDKEVCWAACLDWQTSADALINDSYNGAFTYNFCKIIREANGNIARDDVLQRLRNAMTYNRYAQIPQLECAKRLAKEPVFS